MPRKMVEVEWSLDDYFSKFGFGDGDNADAKDMGRTYIEQAQQLVNEALEVLKLPYRCEQLEVVTMHNDCRLELLKKDGPKGEELEIDFADDGELQDTDRLPPEHAKDLRIALEAAYQTFEDVVQAELDRE